MTQHVSENDVRDIAAYTCIHLDEDEVATMTKDLNDIIESLEPITEYELEGVAPTYYPVGSLENVFREDVVEESFERTVALENAPEQQDGCFLVPSILGDGGDM